MPATGWVAYILRDTAPTSKYQLRNGDISLRGKVGQVPIQACTLKFGLRFVRERL